MELIVWLALSLLASESLFLALALRGRREFEQARAARVALGPAFRSVR